MSDAVPVERTPASDRPIGRRLLAAWRGRGAAPAVRMGDTVVTGRAAADHARQVALALQAVGVARGDTVLVWLGLEPELPSTLAGVLLAGAAFACVDPTQPAARSAGMVSDLEATVLLFGAAAPPVGIATDLSCLDVRHLSPPRGRLRRAVAERAPGYVVFTSGSTGRPKAAVNTRAGLALQLDAWLAVTARGCTVLAQSSPSFDMALIQLLLPCLAGGTTEVAPAQVTREPRLLGELIDKRGVTELLLPPTTWRLLRAEDWRPQRPVRVTFGGEPLPAHVAADAAACGAEVWTGWGVSEAGGCSTLTPWSKGDPVTLGWPVPGALVEARDEAGAPCAQGQTGELWIGGAGVGLGYHNREALSASVFVRDAAGRRWYRTGDLGSLDRRGRVVFAGRADRQLKVRGYRVEAGEVEVALRALPGVVDAAVAAPLGTDGSPTLTAWVVGDEPLNAPPWRALLRANLPAWMIPTRWVHVDALPTTPNGKLDVSALPAPSAHRRRGRAPQGETATRVAAAMATVLGVDPVYDDDDFFTLGGDSLRAAQLTALLRSRHGWALSVAALWEAQTPARVAALVGAGPETSVPVPPLSASGAHEGPCTQTQRQLAWLEALRPGDPALVVQATLRLTLPELTDPRARAAVAARVRAALSYVQATHAGLRTTIHGDRQRIHDALPARWLAAGSGAPVAFDLCRDAPVQARLAYPAPGRADLTLWVHHVALDGAGAAVLCRSFCAAPVWREAQAAPNVDPGAAPREQVAAEPNTQLTAVDVAHWQAAQQTTAALGWWRETLAGVAAPGPLPARGPLEPGGQGAGSTERSLPAQVWRALRGLAATQHATPHMALVGAWVAWAGGALAVPELVVATVTEGRSAAPLRDLVAHLAQTVAVRVPVAAELSGAMAAARSATLDALDHSVCSLDQALHAAGLAGRDAVRMCVLLQPTAPPAMALAAGTLELILAPAAGASFDLGLEAWPQGDGGLALRWTWRTEVARPSDVERAADAFVRWLSASLSGAYAAARLPWDEDAEAAALDLAQVRDARSLTLLADEGTMRQRTWWVPTSGAATPAELAGVPGEHAAVWRLPAAGTQGLPGLPCPLPTAPVRRLANRVAGAQLVAPVAPAAHRAGLTAPPADGVAAPATQTAEAAAEAARLVGLPLPPRVGGPSSLRDLLAHGGRAGARVNGEAASLWHTRAQALADQVARLAPARSAPQVVAVHATRPDLQLLGLHAAWQLGAVAAPLAADARDLDACLSALGATVLLTDRAPAPRQDQVAVVDLRGHDAPAPGRAASANIEPQAPALYLLTSGSTGRPKVVVHSHASVLAQLQAWSLHHGWTSDDVFLNWLPVDHVAALVMFHLQPLYVGATQHHLLPADVLGAPLRWLDALTKTRSTVTWAPNFAVALLVDALAGASGSWDLSALRAVLNGGEAIVPQTARRFATALARYGMAADALCPGWGMSETASACVVRVGCRPADMPTSGLMPLGKPTPGHALRVVDRHDLPVVGAATGRLQVRGPGLLVGYLGEPPREAGWFDTGDLARVVCGELVVVGRGDDTLRVHGASVAPVTLEAAALRVAGVAAPHVAAFNARRGDDSSAGVAVAVALGSQGTGDAAPAAEHDVALAVQRRIGRDTGVPVRWVLTLPASKLPRTALGKVQVQALRRRFESGALDPYVRVGQVARTGVYEEVWRPWSPGPQSPQVVAVVGDELARDAVQAAMGAATVVLPRAETTPRGLADALRLAGPSARLTVVVAVDERTDVAARCSEVATLATAYAATETSIAPMTRWLVWSRAPRAAAVHGVLATLEVESPGTRALLGQCGPGAALATLIRSRWRRAHTVRHTDAGWLAARLTGGAAGLESARAAAHAPGGALSQACVVLVGGGGGVGRLLTAALHGAGARVLVTSRSAAGPAGAGGVSWAQVTSPADLASAVTAWEAEISTAASHVVLLVASSAQGPVAALSSRLSLPRSAYAEAATAIVRARPSCRLLDVNSVHAALPAAGLGRYAADAAWSAAVCRTLGARHLSLYMTAWRGVGLSDPGDDIDGADQQALATAAGLPPLDPTLATGVVLAAMSGASGTWWVGPDPTHSQVGHRSAGGAVAAVRAIGSAAAVATPGERSGHGPRAAVGLQAADRATAAPARVAHPDDIAVVLAAWSSALERPITEVERSFFELGGHSLLVAKVRAELSEALAIDVPMVALFAHPTARAQAEWVGTALGRAPPEPAPQGGGIADADDDRVTTRGAPGSIRGRPSSAAARRREGAEGPLATSGAPQAEPIAIVGMAGRFADCATPAALWSLLERGDHAMRRFTTAELVAAGVPPEVVADPRYVPVRAPLVDADRFDAALFGVSPREAALTDPQHRVFLEVSLAALEDAALDPARFQGRVGVVAGCSPNTYLLNQVLRAPGAAGALGGLASVIASDKDHLATRVAWQLGLRGPALSVGTACSTSLVAVHLACQSLRAGDSDAMVAGGASIAVPLVAGHLFNGPGIASSDGLTRSFSVEAEGTAGGDAVGAVVLRRLADAVAAGDPIYGVIVGSAVTNDGRDRVSYTAPGTAGQARAIRDALAQANLTPDHVGMIEAHGTATPMGDPIEVQALAEALNGRDPALPPVWLGSVKSNLGHTNAAAGVTGLIKATLSLHHERVPATLHVTQVNPALQLDATPLQVATRAVDWPRGALPRYAGVSSFGAGGTNAHVLVGEAPKTAGAPATLPTDRGSASRGSQGLAPTALLLQAADAAALARVRDQLLAWWRAHPGARVADVARTLAEGRTRRAHRAVWWATDPATPWRCLTEAPAAAAPPGSCEVAGTRPSHERAATGAAARVRPTPAAVVFVVPGQGLQRVGAGAQAAGRNPAFAAAFAQASAACLAAGGPDLRRFLHGDPADERLQERLDDQRNAGPQTLALAWATGRALQAAGLQPDVLMGQSTGEFAAAALAGVMSLTDAMRFMVARAELLADTPRGAVVAAALSADELRTRLVPGTWLALRNGPSAAVAAGTPAGAQALCAVLAAEGVPHQQLRVSVAAHSPLIAAVEEPLLALASTFELKPPSTAMVSAVTGRRLDAAAVRSPRYWARHAMEPVDVVSAFETLRGWGGDAVHVELGPARCMASVCRWNAPGAPHVAPHTPSERADPVLRAVAEAVAHGAPLGLNPRPDRQGRRLHLPTYPFARERHWVDAPAPTADARARPGTAEGEAATGRAVHQGAALALTMASEAAPPTKADVGTHARPAQSVPYRPPSTPAERSLVAMSEALLGIDGIGVDDDFFALGGDSLITMRLIAEIRRQHGVEIPAAAAFDGFSVARLATYVPALPSTPAVPLATGAANAPGATLGPAPERPATPSPGGNPTTVGAPRAPGALPPCLVPLRRSGSKAPLFFIHPAAGVVFPYVELARTLDADRPFWGLQAAGLDGREAPDLDVPAMARRYIRAIRQVQPHGPYHLGAFSFGCYVAFEMALQLDEAQETVGLLALVDEAAPLDGHRPSAAMMSRIIFGRAGKTFLHHLHDYAFLRDANRRARGGKGTVTRLLGARGQRTVRQLLQRSTMAALLPDDSHEIALDQGAMNPMFKLLAIHLRETLRYTPARPLPINATLLTSQWATDRPFWVRSDPDPTFGWSDLAQRGVDIRRLTGDHLALIRHPHVVRLATELESALRDAEAR